MRIFYALNLLLVPCGFTAGKGYVHSDGYSGYNKLEEELKDLTPQERKLKRLELEKPVLEAFWC